MRIGNKSPIEKGCRSHQRCLGALANLVADGFLEQEGGLSICLKDVKEEFGQLKKEKKKKRIGFIGQLLEKLN